MYSFYAPDLPAPVGTEVLGLEAGRAGEQYRYGIHPADLYFGSFHGQVQDVPSDPPVVGDEMEMPSAAVQGRHVRWTEQADDGALDVLPLPGGLLLLHHL